MASATFFDLTPVMSSYFDPHMVTSIYDHLRDLNIYDKKIVTKEKIKTLLLTNLIDLVDEEYALFPDDNDMQNEFKSMAVELEARRNNIFDQLDNPPEDVVKVKAFFDQVDVVKQLKEEHTLTLEYLSTNHGLTVEILENYYKYSKLYYECGDYSQAEEMLDNFLSIHQLNTPYHLKALWGRLACKIVQAKWDASLADLEKVQEAIDSKHIAPIDQLRQRAWVLHWGLLVYINQREGVDSLTEFFSNKVYLQALENLCPWLLRYYTAFIILSPNSRRNKLRDVLREIESLSHTYSDPITEFLSSLFTQFDFDNAQIKLKECQELIKNDFFLQIYADSFMKQARLLICEMYCTINRNVDIVMLADKLQLSKEEAEKWMVDIVRGSTSGPTHDAKIDSSANLVIMSKPSKAAYQTVIDKTKDVTLRSGILTSNLTALLNEQHILIKNRDQIITSKGRL